MTDFHEPDDDFDDWMNAQERCDLCGRDDCTCGECGMMPNGQCALAGTEHCDWDCTYPNSVRGST